MNHARHFVIVLLLVLMLMRRRNVDSRWDCSRSMSVVCWHDDNVGGWSLRFVCRKAGLFTLVNADFMRQKRWDAILLPTTVQSGVDSGDGGKFIRA
jgi:hypothetical protein